MNIFAPFEVLVLPSSRLLSYLQDSKIANILLILQLSEYLGGAYNRQWEMDKRIVQSGI